MSRSFKFATSFLSVALVLSGCRVKSPPDPNDPATVGIMQPEVLQRNLRWASDMVNDRVAKEEVSDDEGQKMLARYANQLIEKVDFKQMRETQAWQYADIFRTARRWDLAEKALVMAVAHAKKFKNDDRRVNDTLRLAQAQAHLGRFKDSIETARTTFDARDQDKAPILLSVLYEIAPAVRGHGLDVELAELLEGAIAQHNLVLVDPKDDSGKAFMLAKPHHLRNAWDLVVELYLSAGKPEKAEEARRKRETMLGNIGRL